MGLGQSVKIRVRWTDRVNWKAVGFLSLSQYHLVNVLKSGIQLTMLKFWMYG